MLRTFPLPLAALLALAACGDNGDLGPVEPFGDFRLGHAIAVADSAEPVGPSRTATAEEWETSISTDLRAQLGRYQGDKLYHIGVGVQGYALAVPGIPVLLSPKSVLVIAVDVWDDTAQRTINTEPKQMTVFEGLNGETLVGSGITKSREEQMATLSRNAARMINDWLVENQAWFTPEAVAARAAAAPPLPPEKAAALKAAEGATTGTTTGATTAATAPPASPQPAPAPGN